MGEEFRNVTIPQFWIDNGFTAETLPIWYNTLAVIMIAFFFISIINWTVAYIVRKKMDPLKHFGAKPMTSLERYAQACKFGQEPAMNFVSSTLVTNDRVYVIIRLTIAIWSLSLTAMINEGLRTWIFGSYFPLALVLSIYVNFNRHLIIQGFGSKAQTCNKILSFIFNLQAPLRLILSLTMWTKWFGTSRVRDISRRMDASRFILFNKEFAPSLFLLVELLWFDTKVSYFGVWAPVFICCITGISLLRAMNPEPPQASLAMFNRPYSTTLHAFIFFFGIIVIQWGLASICLFKIWIFKKIPVIGERLTTRQKCAAVFKKRQAFNYYFKGTEVAKKRKSTAASEFGNIGKRMSTGKRVSTMERL
ncbi:Oidioi.mRNA.OKI2018_I69.PAR.g8814.t1.cds [Oikopleura dioica]|uniref:Oidioi.mRNA.OKI2018_I69.PAR.g8814.t1.cds n=1 Tax=Oikopleura dioica TaxID=34765 RepID=A0ABN7RLS4_OIKDI|nr:Oidioi.mRNA.OKI2018_I69.PAR.g8814.t1.cds [Oikopleura dioica]